MGVDAYGVHGDTYKHSFPERFADGFQAELEAFVDVVLGKAAWPVTKRDCVVVQLIAQLAEQSARDGGNKIKFEMPLCVQRPDSVPWFSKEGLELHVSSPVSQNASLYSSE